MSTPFSSDGWADPNLAATLAAAIKRAIREELPGGANSIPVMSLRFGKVAAVNADGTINVYIGGDPVATTDVPKLSWYTPAVEDIVAIIVTGINQYLCLGSTG